MPSGPELHRRSTTALSVVMLTIGVVMVVSTIVRGGGPLAVGIVIGLLFVAAGAARLYLATRES